MKKFLFLFAIIGLLIASDLQAQKSFKTKRPNIKVINNELLEIQKDGLINWTQGYLEGIGKMNTSVPMYEEAAGALALSNLCSLFETVRIVDTLSLTMMAEKNEVFRQIIKVMEAEIRGSSLSPVEIKNDTCYIRATIDFETLLIFKYNDVTLIEWVNKFYQPQKTDENQNIVVNKTKVPIYSYEKLENVKDSLGKLSSNSELFSDSIIIVNKDKQIGVIAGNNSTPAMVAGVKNIYIRLNGKLYNPTPNFDYGKLVPVKWQPLVNLSVNTLLEITSASEKAPKWLKAIQMQDGSIVYDIDKIIEKKEKWQKVGNFVLQLLDVIIGLVK